MIELKTPRGLPVKVPETLAEDPSPRFAWDEREGITKYYQENGYVIVRALLDGAACDRIRQLWDSEIKPSSAYIYRQATAKAERHKLNDKGWIMNPILNLQSVDPVRYPNFRRFAVDNVLTDGHLCDAFRALMGGEAPKIVQSMYFEGNSATWEHQDSYYLDSAKIGSMAGAWIAVEDISARAGRFFICPKSHLIDLGRQDAANNIADNHEVYIQQVVAQIRERGLTIRAPVLNKGDVLFWNAWTIHGSLDSQDPDQARSSITCHAIPDSHDFLQLQSRILPLDLKSINGIRIHHPKDLSRLSNRAVFALETRFPGVFYGAKKMLLRAMIGARSKRAQA